MKNWFLGVVIPLIISELLTEGLTIQTDDYGTMTNITLTMTAFRKCV